MISSDAMFNKKRPEWAPTEILVATDKSSLPYVKVPWDIEQSATFAPWRLEPITPQELTLDDGFKPSSVGGGEAEVVSDAEAETDAEAAADAGPDVQAADGQAAESTPTAAPEAEPATEMTTLAVDALEAQSAAARQAGYDEGFAAGEAIGFEKGQAAGESEGRVAGAAEAHAEFTAALGALNAATASVKTLNDDPQQYFDPLKKLALHLAEELVRGELTLSPTAIERLVQLSLEALDTPSKRVVVQMHPDDLAQIQGHAFGLESGLVLQADASLTRGSVQVNSNDAVVQDLIQKRLRALANKVLLAPDDWQASSRAMTDGPLWATVEDSTDPSQTTEDATMVSREAPLPETDPDA